jgi:chitodextrinase
MIIRALHHNNCDRSSRLNEFLSAWKPNGRPRPRTNRLIRPLVALMLMSLGASAQTLLFKSGFEGNTALETIPADATGDDFQHFSGLDSTTGFTWPMSFWNVYAVTTGLHPIVGGSNSVIATVTDDIESVVGHTGATTQALKIGTSAPSPGFCCSQVSIQVASPLQQVTDFYVRYWTKLNPEFLAQEQAGAGNFFRTQLEMKTSTDYRIATHIYGQASGVPYWAVVVDDTPEGQGPPCPVNACWEAYNHTVPVPTSNWMLMEFYLHRSTGSDGRFFWAVNGQTIVDHTGPTYGANAENFDFLAFLNVYGTDMQPAYQWVDDMEVWDLPPCATLPCGAGTNNVSSAPTTPANVTAAPVSSNQINLAWTASTDGVGIAGYRVYRNGGTTPIAAVTSATAYQDSGLTPATPYSYTVAAYDTMGYTSAPSAAASATTPSAAAIACPAPVALAWTGCYYVDPNLTTLGLVRTDPTILFNWGAGSPGPAIPAGHFSARWKGIFNFNAASYTFTVTADDGFRLYIDGVTVMDHWVDQSATYTQTLALTAGNHTITMEYYNDTGSAAANLQWQLAPTVSDTQAPTTPANLTASAVSSSQIKLSWSASTDNVGVAGYKIYRNGGTTPIATVTSGTTYQNTGLASGTSYSYTVAAYDAAGNTSAQSGVAFGTTLWSSRRRH